MLSRYRGRGGIVWMLALGLALTAWGSHFLRQYLSARRSDVWKRGAALYLLAGSRLDILPYVMEIGGGSKRRQPEQILLYYFSDNCGFCRANCPHMEELVRRLRPVAGGELWFVTRDTSAGLASAVQIARSRGQQVRLFKVAEADVFARATGLAGTPTTVLIDGERDIRSIWYGGTEAATAKIVAAWDLMKPSQSTKERVDPLRY